MSPYHVRCPRLSCGIFHHAPTRRGFRFPLTAPTCRGWFSPTVFPQKKFLPHPFVPYSSSYVLPTRHRNLPAVPTTSFVSGSPCTTICFSRCVLALSADVFFTRRALQPERVPVPRCTHLFHGAAVLLASEPRRETRLGTKKESDCVEWPLSEKARGLERASPGTLSQ